MWPPREVKINEHHRSAIVRHAYPCPLPMPTGHTLGWTGCDPVLRWPRPLGKAQASGDRLPMKDVDACRCGGTPVIGERSVGRSSFLLLLVAVAGGGWYVLKHFEIRGLDQLKMIRRDSPAADVESTPPDQRDKRTIRIAAFNLRNFGPTKADNPAVMEVLGRVIREFDIVALQEVCSARPDVLRKLLDRVNETGRHYSLLVGPPMGRTQYTEYYVYIFDQATIETDRSACYSVDDPDDLLHRPPLVGVFRARGPPADRAFTFCLADVHTDPDEAHREITALADAYFKIRDDGRGEDDLIMLGDFNLDDQQLGELSQMSGFLATIVGRPTNTRQTHQYDNLVFQLPATCEYAGRSGVFDFMREYNLTLDQALQISDHLPVWAEFSLYEGGNNPAVIAAQGRAAVR